MNRYISKELQRMNNRIKLFESMSNSEKEDFIRVLINEVRDVTLEYYVIDDESEKEEIKDILLDDYNVLNYYISLDSKNFAKIFDALRGLPNIFLIDQKPERFNIDEELLNSIVLEEGLTMQQAIELLKWTANNTRDNLNLSNVHGGREANVYDNDSLVGACGFSTFSTLYPLQQLGLEITVNNMWSISRSHAFGTVTIPIKTEEGIIKKRFLIDCTYRQFFVLEDNVAVQFLRNNNQYAPQAGFFVMKDEANIEFAKEVLKNGFFELTKENMEYYFKPFFSFKYNIHNLDKIDEDFSKLDVINILDNEQDEFDYDRDEFDTWGMNLDLPNNKNNFMKR